MWRREKGGTAWKKGYGIIVLFSIVTVGISTVAIVVASDSVNIVAAVDVVNAISVISVLLLLV